MSCKVDLPRRWCMDQAEHEHSLLEPVISGPAVEDYFDEIEDALPGVVATVGGPANPG